MASLSGQSKARPSKAKARQTKAIAATFWDKFYWIWHRSSTAVMRLERSIDDVIKMRQFTTWQLWLGWLNPWRSGPLPGASHFGLFDQGFESCPPKLNRRTQFEQWDQLLKAYQDISLVIIALVKIITLASLDHRRDAVHEHHTNWCDAIKLIWNGSFNAEPSKVLVKEI